MDWTAPIDIYCERLGPGFWAEPWNALSNIAFLLAALWGLAEARRRDALNAANLALIALASAIGIGSFLFHSFATTWSALADVGPIWAFVALAVLVGMARIGGMAPGRIARFAILATLLAIALTGIFGLAMRAPDDTAAGAAAVAAGISETSQTAGASARPLNGSLQYAPAQAALAVFALVAWRRGSPQAPWVVAATVLFFLSLGFRSVDMALCARFPHGTHFLWHILNGATIALLLQVLIRSGAAPPPPRGGQGSRLQGNSVSAQA